MKMRTAALLFGLLCCTIASPASAQDQSLEEFVQHVARLWAGSETSALVALAADGRLVLDTGDGTETVSSRHAAAALRSLFADRDNVRVRPFGLTLAGDAPPSGFAELAWSFRTRAAPAVQTRSVYVGVVREADGWRLTELRLMPGAGN